MSDLKSQEQIDEMRKRLYSRGFDTARSQRHSLTDKKVDVARAWGGPLAIPDSPHQEETPTTDESVPSEIDTHTIQLVAEKPPRRYRRFVLIGSLVIFTLVAILSSAFLFMGGNQISSDNITIGITGPITVNGGETMTLQVGVTNQNTVGIESTTLVLKYPPGIRTVEEPIEMLTEQRIAIDMLAPGEARNITVPIGIFGRENEQKQIQATLEYRIVNSNGTFFKEAEPFNFQITSSPLILQVTSLNQVVAGQVIDVVLTAKSNASTPLKNVLITAEFPNSFVYKSADPKPIYNQNVWLIEELLPEQSVTINLKGSITGLTSEGFGINFTAGLAQANNQYIVGASLAEARSEFTIERPFIDVGIKINEDTDNSAVIAPGEKADVVIDISNTLDETVYDMVVEVVPSGNALRPESISSNQGFYDSNTGKIRFEVANNNSFESVLPGDTRSVSFSIAPDAAQGTATFELAVNVFARRVAERGAQEQLIGTVKAEARYASNAALTSSATLIAGPLPPQVGQTTEYKVTLAAQAGGNNVSDTVVTTSLPAYVNWLDAYQGEGAVSYNPSLKQIEWRVGNIDANRTKELVFSVSLLPSTSQVGITPVLVNSQDLRGTDSFTGTSLRASARSFTTELPLSSGYEEGNGRITNTQ